jgi:cell division GTPase FtsZ
MCYKVAIVGFGGAGTSIITKIIEIIEEIDRIKDATTLYVVDDAIDVKLGDVIFYEYHERRGLVKELLDYDWVILTSGLGGRGGDSLVYVANSLDNVLSVFVVYPLSIEKIRIGRANIQLSSLKVESKIVIKWLNDVVKTLPTLPLSLALDFVDREIAMNIISLIYDPWTINI